MNFKKIKIEKKSSNKKNILIIIIGGIFILMIIFILKNWVFFSFEKIDKWWVLSWAVETPKTENEEKWWFLSSMLGKNDSSPQEDDINILIVGRWGWMNDAPDLTDTIILAKANAKNKTISMLSIPRDLYVEYPWNETFNSKINWIYSRYMNYRQSVDYWMEMLAKKVTEITGEDVDYYINVDFAWFIEIIDTLWGVVIDVPEDFIDNEFPDDNWWYRTLIFRKWTWLFDWEDALKYVRSRHSTSDFDRSLRQQQVINALKDKILSKYLITSPSKIKELYNVFNKNIKTDISLTKALSFAYSFRNIDEFSIITSNVNDSCFYGSGVCTKWWILYVPQRDMFNGASVLLFYWSDISNLSNYELPKVYSNIVFNYPKISVENAHVNIFNSLKINNLAYTLSNDTIRYGFNVTQLWNTWQEEYEKSTIYFNNISKDSDTIKALKLFFNWEFIETPLPKYSTDSAKIEIIMWKDYKTAFKF